MTPRELVIDSLEFRGAARVPRGRRFAGKLTFWGEVDRQHLLPYGAPAGERRRGVRGMGGS
ncbi:MAG: hypothetical protein A2W20_07195 [Candidatus Aminicenantes bacterium RBG_16_66_30]|nr:MAG: hypothetical protein A2W20_07195 [Candidatus Aminicenantes bacterium RBG_16_66_30]